MIIDTHCHLNDLKLLPEASRIVGEFLNDGIESAVCVGSDIETSRLAVEQAGEFDNIYAAVGIHPHESEGTDEKDYEAIKEMSSNPKTVAIGEIGLDYHYDLSPRDIQRKVFSDQLVLADEVKLPVILHIRDAYEDARQILFNNKDHINSGLLFHCYSGSKEYVKIYSELDAYFAFGGAITFKNAVHNIESLKAVPLDRLLVETDCPYMTPVPFRGKDNEPKYINLVVDKMAEVLGMSREDIIKITTENAKRLFTRLK